MSKPNGSDASTSSTSSTPSTSTSCFPPPRSEQSIHIHMMGPWWHYPFPPFVSFRYTQDPVGLYSNMPTFNIPQPFPPGVLLMSQAMAAVPGYNSPPIITNPPVHFGLPPDNRGNLAAIEEIANEDRTQNRLVELYEPISLRVMLRGNREWHDYPVEVTTDDFCRFLEHGCIIAERIAAKNTHRPCFKNIESLCSRTRGEIVKPGNTAANIHSQGLPWATKDFIYAYIRVINCWHMLQGYACSIPGSLGTVESELSVDFRNTFESWERDTKMLASHMIRIFTNLNDSVVNVTRIAPFEAVNSEEEAMPRPIPVSRSLPRTPGPRRPEPNIHQPSTSKTGTIPKQPQKKKSTMQTDQFEDSSSSSEQMWQEAQSKLPYLMASLKQAEASVAMGETSFQNLFPPDNLQMSASAPSISMKCPLGILKPPSYYLTKRDTSQSKDRAEGVSPFPPESPSSFRPERSVTFFDPGRSTSFRPESPVMVCSDRPPSNRADSLYSGASYVEPSWEYEGGGLTPRANVVLENILDLMENESLEMWLVYAEHFDCIELPTSIGMIREKLNTQQYEYINQFIYDFKNLMDNALSYYESQENQDAVDQICYHKIQFSNIINSEFPEYDFSQVGSYPFGSLGPLVPKMN